MSPSTILELSSIIASNTVIYHEYLASHGFPEPSHQVSQAVPVFSSLPEYIETVRDRAVEASHELHTLLLGPVGSVLSAAAEQNKLLSLHFIRHYKIAERFSASEKLSFKQIADQCNLDEDDTKRLLRLAMSDHLFQEPEIGTVAHTAQSQVLGENPLLAAWIGVTTQENWPSMTRVVDAVGRWPGSEEPLESAYSLAHNINENPFTIWERDPPRAKQFADAMKFLHSDSGFQPEFLVEGYDFTSIGQGVFVDVGGSHGEVSIAIARKYPHLSCIVQDMPATVELGRAQLDEDLKDRVSFMAHDFWQEQPVQGADIYYFRWIFHDWSDKYSVKILRALIPALKRGAKIIINDVAIPPPGLISLYKERWLRGLDIVMKSFTNAKEREGDDWVALFGKADPRFKFSSLKMPAGSKCAIIEAEWQP